ncbi:FecR domain-containing protein [SAR92 clade bacterium H231]|nr:FecR domain-containing protein [SAR92 clade bacterium H231]
MDNVLEFPDSSAIEREAASWMVKLDGDQPLSPAEQDELQRWMANSPAHRDELERLAELWGLLNVLTVLAVPLEKQHISLSQRLVQGLQAQWAGLLHTAVSVRGVSALCLLGLALVVLSIYLQPTSPSASNGLYQTAIGQQSTTRLSDNSSILLNTNSKVRVEYSEHSRKIYLLQGEAHFDVAPNKKIPFQVYAGDGLVQAVGTAFSVYLQQGEVVKVTVTEGKVKVMGEPLNSQQQTNPRIDLATLKAGQIGTLERVDSSHRGSNQPPTNRASFLQTLESIDQQELDRQLAWHTGLVMFAGESLEQVVHEISRYSELNIRITDPSLKTLKIGGQFRIGETNAMFDVLESNFNIQVDHLANGQVTLSSGPSS